VKIRPCVGHGGKCKNNGQFNGLCYFCLPTAVDLGR
jgi:hypothetical protein